MGKNLNEKQKEILEFYKENGLKKTCETFNLKNHQVWYLITKK